MDIKDRGKRCLLAFNVSRKINQHAISTISLSLSLSLSLSPSFSPSLSLFFPNVRNAFDVNRVMRCFSRSRTTLATYMPSSPNA